MKKDEKIERGKGEGDVSRRKREEKGVEDEGLGFLSIIPYIGPQYLI